VEGNTMKKLSEKQLIQNFADAALLFIQKNSPAGFNLALFQIYIMSGRIEDATSYLQNFKSEGKETES
jgi:hypothetical protein